MIRPIIYDPGTIIRFELGTNQRVAIQSSNNLAPVMDLKFPVEEPYARLVGRWIIECRNHMIFMRENDSSELDDCMVISFQQPRVDVNVESCSVEGNKKACFQSVNRIDVYPGKVGKIIIKTSEQPLEAEECEEACLKGEDQDPGSAVTQTEEALERLRSDLDWEKTVEKHLQEIIDSKLDEMLQAAAKNSQYLSSESQSKIQMLEALNSKSDCLEQELQEITTQIEEAEQRMEAKNVEIQAQKDKLTIIQNQLEELNSRQELTELDCDAAQAQLEEVKARVGADADTLVLVENGYQLKHGTISKTLDEMNKEIEKAEKRIAFILKFRTKLNQTIEDAIFSGDGTILASDETGENLDGIGSTASSENS